jgi:hypothetical protein
MKLTVEYVYNEITDGLNRALPAIIMAMFMMVIASLQTPEAELVTNFAVGSSICFSALSAFLIWGPIDKSRLHIWQNLAVIFFATGFALFIITIFAFYYETFFG